MPKSSASASVLISGGKWLAPAKLNLFLHVIAKRADGYHNLQTAFVFLDYYDVLTFETTPNNQIKRIDHSSNQSLPENDLCVQAARLLQVTAKAKQNITPGVTITLEKNIASGAGLGGGSSDAATCLLALNKLWNCGFNREQLAQLGLQLGADVPVFIYGQAAWAEGLGEQLTPIEPEKKWVCVIIPPIHVSTAQIFSDSALTHTPAITKIRGSFSPGLGNDLAAVTCAHYPVVAEALKWLSGFGAARMSGSGGSVFLDCDSREQAQTILKQRPLEYNGFVAQSLNKHPHS